MKHGRTELVRRALAVNQAMLALGNEVFEAEGGTFVRNRSLPTTHDANHVAHVTASTPDQVDRLLARVDREYAGFGCKHRCFHLDPACPPEVEARLALDGYRRSDALLMLLEDEPRGEPQPHDIRLVEGDAGWAAYGALNAADFAYYTERVGDDLGEWSAEQMLASRRIKSPPVRFWLAYVDGEPRSYLASWEGTEGIGQVEDLFTHTDFRHRGLATALLHHCIRDCRAHGAGPVVIVCDPDDTPKEMYAAIGFRPIAIKRNWWRQVEA